MPAAAGLIWVQKAKRALLLLDQGGIQYTSIGLETSGGRHVRFVKNCPARFPFGRGCRRRKSCCSVAFHRIKFTQASLWYCGFGLPVPRGSLENPARPCPPSRNRRLM